MRMAEVIVAASENTVNFTKLIIGEAAVGKGTSRVLLVTHQYTTVQCSAVQCTVLNCTAFHCTVLYCIGRELWNTWQYKRGRARANIVMAALVGHQCTALFCPALHCTLRSCTALSCSILCCTALCCTALFCTVLYLFS